MSRYHWSNEVLRNAVREIATEAIEVEEQTSPEPERATEEQEPLRLREETRVRIQKAIAEARLKADRAVKAVEEGEYQICPMCENEATVHKFTQHTNLNIKGIMIRVKQTLSQCEECGEEFVSPDDEDYLQEAYTIYMKMKDPANRKFKKIHFSGGIAWVYMCKRCSKTYGFEFKTAPLPPGGELKCCLKGCSRTALRSLKLDKI